MIVPPAVVISIVVIWVPVFRTLIPFGANVQSVVTQLGYGQRISWNDVIDAGATLRWEKRDRNEDIRNDAAPTIYATTLHSVEQGRGAI